LTVAAAEPTGIGDYQLSLSVLPAPDVMTTTLPLAVPSGGTPSGLGVLSSIHDTDEYRFSVPASSTGLSLHWPDASGDFESVSWSLLEASSRASIQEGQSSRSESAIEAPPGDYVLRVASHNGYTGPYEFNLASDQEVAVPVTLPVQVTADQPAAGAGRLESVGSVDTYTFHLDRAEIVLGVDFDVVPPGQQLPSWTLINSDTRTPVASDSSTSHVTGVLTSGNYRLDVYASTPTATGAGTAARIGDRLGQAA
jgi:hypothetical protein